ncbi:hypothetical protein [Halotia branconii]|uniref:Uncharacterized protein n=1 Tax=Halotia branconii CENA392 TaxID=1539056 RepID=A0AAJ6P7S4_9CYAN|nr:hypothetical protein [Halotia branconii]WGV24044.1 hypothetical protein QI031_19840 [Halotia branconii CENA392]WGV28023.1 hypothetical protein QI031_11305 [Halotia branconii CENA392]WGV29047.1 hypothetical protein QI031_31300 [Halotia branconii CENA392]
MPQSPKSSIQDDLAKRVDAVVKIKQRLEQEIHSILALGKVAPASCWIVRYQAKGRNDNYWYYKLQASSPIFPTKTDGKLSRYQHLGKAGSQAYIDALEQITRRAKIEALDRSIESLNLGLKDLIEETSKYRQQ